MQRPMLSSLYLHTMAGEAKMGSIKPKEFYAKRLEQLSKGGVKYQGLQWGYFGDY